MFTVIFHYGNGQSSQKEITETDYENARYQVYGMLEQKWIEFPLNEVNCTLIATRSITRVQVLYTPEGSKRETIKPEQEEELVC